MGIATLLVLVCGAANGRPAELMWQVLSQRAVAVAACAPGRVESHTEVLGGNGAVRGTVVETWALAGWEHGQASYDVQRDETGDPDIAVQLRLTGRSTPFLASAEGRVTQRAAVPVELDGRCLIRFDFTERREEKPGKTVTLDGSAWLDATSGAPWRVVYRHPAPHAPLKRWELTLQFADDPEAPPLPTQARLEMEGQVLLWKRTVSVRQSLTHWQRPP